MLDMLPSLEMDSAPPTECPKLSFTRLSLLWPEIAALCVYAGILAAAIPYHEPWADEAQAWQLAKNL